MVFLVLLGALVQGFSGTSSTYILVADGGHGGGNITGSSIYAGTPQDANLRKTGNRVQGDHMIGNTYVNGTPAGITGRYGLLNIDIFNPVITTSPAATNVLVSQATITWQTDEDATTVVNYGTASDVLSLSKSDSSFATSHSMTIFDLGQHTTYFFNVTTCDRFNFCKYSGTFSFVTLSEAPADTSSGGFGGGGVSRTTAGYSVTKKFASIPADKIIQIPIVSQNMAFTKVMFKLKKAVENAEIKITRFNPKIPDAPEVKNVAVYQYLKIDHDKINDEDVAVTTITFSVLREWLKDHGLAPENVVLLRLIDNVWKEMPTSKISESGVTVGYESTFQGLSYYAVAAKAKKETVIETGDKPIPVGEEEKEETVEEEKEEVTPPEEKTEEQPPTPPVVETQTQLWTGVIIFVVLLVIGYLIYRRMER